MVVSWIREIMLVVGIGKEVVIKVEKEIEIFFVDFYVGFVGVGK